ncbi:heme ABC transporter ATP-binding protein [Microbacterium ulmi]|uniref:Heme ABC transporter ATP-binding protein n=1 Tax=Microbacterium ulmi TaxID=179095 RepID=A0A7Y2LZ36_9MICO|nr:heme ABC transporter ATP-binding protein [Microbacterium ulmi]NII69617.1 iron complex transport system ATP-binding protein [Microbacterium ulmi]NNH03495.1 heme ABC transporter ATP-binding protein [Microbacterium ulmi]
MTRPVMSVQGVAVDLGGAAILTDVTLELLEGELLALVGPNGAGKSTLLSVLAGDRSPSRGTVLIDGAPLDAAPVADLARRRSVLTQSNEISFPFPVIDVVRMGRAPWRSRPEADRDEEMVELAMHAGEVKALADHPVTTLSGGERARVAFARSRAQSCAIVLLDEPTASLDIRHQHRVLAETRAHARAGGSAVVVLHDLGLAAAYADRIAILAGGEIVSVGPPREVLDPDVLTRVYRHPVGVFDGPDGEIIVAARATGVAAAEEVTA